jgi:hypothetical protein
MACSRGPHAAPAMQEPHRTLGMAPSAPLCHLDPGRISEVTLLT